MLAHHITKLPLQPEAEDAPDNLLFNQLGCNPLSYAEVIQEKYRVLVHTLHQDKNKAASVTASKYKTKRNGPENLSAQAVTRKQKTAPCKQSLVNQSNKTKQESTQNISCL